MAKRYVKIPVLVLGDGTKVTVDKLKFVEREDFPNEYVYGTSWHDKTSANLTEFIYDIAEQKFVDIEIINYYPTPGYVVGKQYLIEQNHHDLKREVLKEIIFNDYDPQYIKYEDLVRQEYYFELLTPEQKTKLIPSSLVEIRTYKPTYIFESGYETVWSHKFYNEV